MRTSDQWARVLVDCGVKVATAAKWGEAFADEIDDDTFSADEQDLYEFLPTILHESGMLERLRENLNYSAERLTKVWPSRFPNVAAAMPYANNPDGLAERVYGGRMGNTAPGDGAHYIGRGIIMITGKANYAKTGDLMGQDLVGLPELLEQPRYALEAAIKWWESTIPDEMLGETTSIRQRVNGGKIGLDEVQSLKKKAIRALNA